jgi:hypothetical protein
MIWHRYTFIAVRLVFDHLSALPGGPRYLDNTAVSPPFFNPVEEIGRIWSLPSAGIQLGRNSLRYSMKRRCGITSSDLIGRIGCKGSSEATIHNRQHENPRTPAWYTDKAIEEAAKWEYHQFQNRY